MKKLMHAVNAAVHVTSTDKLDGEKMEPARKAVESLKFTDMPVSLQRHVIIDALKSGSKKPRAMHSLNLEEFNERVRNMLESSRTIRSTTKDVLADFQSVVDILSTYDRLKIQKFYWILAVGDIVRAGRGPELIEELIRMGTIVKPVSDSAVFSMLYDFKWDSLRKLPHQDIQLPLMPADLTYIWEIVSSASLTNVDSHNLEKVADFGMRLLKQPDLDAYSVEKVVPRLHFNIGRIVVQDTLLQAIYDDPARRPLFIAIVERWKATDARRAAEVVAKLLASRKGTFQEFHDLVLANSPLKSTILKDVFQEDLSRSSLYEGIVRAVCDDAALRTNPCILRELVEQNRPVELAELLAVSPPPVKPSTFQISTLYASHDVIRILVDYEERYIREVYAPYVEARLQEFRQEGADDKMETPHSILACLYSHLPLTKTDFGWDYKEERRYINDCMMTWTDLDLFSKCLVVEPGILKSRSLQKICLENREYLSIARVAEAVHSSTAMETFRALLTGWPAIEMPEVLEAALGIALANGKSDLVRLFKEHGFPSQ